PSWMRLAPLVLVWLAACGHDVTPTEPYDTPEEIPVPTMLLVRPAVFGPYLTWDTPDSDFVIVAGWHVYRRRPDGDERRLTSEPLVMRQYQDPDTPQVGQTFYWVTAESRGGVESLPTPPVRFLRDDLPPMPPTGLLADAGPDLVLLRWQTGLEFDLAGYRVERDAVEIGIVGDPAMPAFIDRTVVAGATYVYAIRAVDFSNLVSEPGPGVTVTIPLTNGQPIAPRTIE
ncbi:MAG TPA: hypothetical protein VF720_12090, partial [Candidatus Eisenbacteria bacterium]